MSLLEDYLKCHAVGVLEGLFGKDPLAPHQVNLSEIKRILVIRQHDQLGDFLLATPVLRALREHFPDARIGLVVREYFSDVAAYVPYVDDVLVFRANVAHWDWNSLTSFYRALRSGWDMTVVLNTVSHSFTSDILARFSRARYVVGSSAHLFRGSARNFFYNLIAPLRESPRHQSERNLDIVRYIGVDTADTSEEIHIPDNEKNLAREVLAERGLSHALPVIGMHIGAGKMENRWPVKRFAELARMLHEKFNAQIVIFWGPREKNLCTDFCDAVAFQPVMGEPTTLAKLAACYSQCDALVCNDTGTMHLAAAVGIPVVAIFGPTDPKEWMPAGKCLGNVRGKGGKTENVQAAEVLLELRRLLGDDLKSATARGTVA